MEKMRKKGYLYLIFISVLLLLAGCQGTGTKQPVKVGTFFGGTDGVSISFVEIFPPTKLDQNDIVPVKVLLENKGEYDLVAGAVKAKIFGVNLNAFSLSGNYIATKGTLIGKSEGSFIGGKQEINFGNLHYTIPVTNSEDFTLRARVCYPYQTKGIINVCLKSAISKEAGEGVCNLEGEKVGGKDKKSGAKGSVSAGPIQITSVTEQTRGSDEIRFDIKIENKGKGDVYSPESICDELEDDVKRLEKRDQVEIEVLNPGDVRCRFITGDESNKGIVSLNKGIGTISCFKKVQDTIEDKLSINVNYVYIDSASKQITIFQSSNTR